MHNSWVEMPDLQPVGGKSCRNLHQQLNFISTIQSMEGDCFWVRARISLG